MSPGARGLAAVAFAAALGLTGCGGQRADGGGERPAASAEAPPNVVLVTVDTLRADRLGAYGDVLAATPHLDRIAREGALFTRATAPVPLTLPSHATLLTGRQPYSTGVRINGADRLPEAEITLAERLAAAGWRTAAFVSAFPVLRRFGLDQGFAVYEDSLGGREGYRFTDELPAGEVVGRFASWLEQAADDTAPIFAWLHLYDPHQPWTAPEPFRSRFPDDPYRAEVAAVDQAIGELLGVLAAAGRLESTLLVVTSDHGEAFGEHGEHGHGILAYEEVLHVPLLMRWPGRIAAGTRVATRVALADVAPTLLELTGAAGGPLPVDGRSLASSLDGAELASRPVYFESLLGAEAHGWAPLRGLVADDLKLIALPIPELYDLAADPAESRNLYAERRRLARPLLDELRELPAAPADDRADRPLSAEERRSLAALGYATPGDGARPVVDGEAVDPKLALPLHQRLSAAEAHAERGEVDLALAMIEEAAQSPLARRMPAYYFARFDAHRARGESRLAAEALHQGLAAFPGLEQMRFQRAAYLLELGRLKEAEGEARELLRRVPHYAEAHELLSRLGEQRGDPAAALAALERAAELDPSHRDWLRRLAPLRLAAGDAAGAAEVIRALDAQGGLAGADDLVQAALVHAMAGADEAAEDYFRRALVLRREPRDLLMRASFLIQQGRGAEAAETLAALEDLALPPAEAAFRDRLLRESASGGSG